MSTFSLKSNGIDMGKPYSSKISWSYGGVSPLQGRWISYSPALDQYLIGDQGNNPEIYRSNDLLTWTSIPALSGGRWFNARWSPALNLWLAVANNLGAVTGGWTSPNGINWTGPNASLGGAPHQWVVWSPTLALFLVITQFQNLSTSPDGVTFTPRDLTVAHNGTHFCGIWDTINNMFVVLDATGGGTAARRIHTSINGTLWQHPVTPQVGGIDPNWQRIIHAPELGLNLCVAGNGAGQGQGMISSDNITWSLVNIHTDDPAPAMFGGSWSPDARAFCVPVSSGNPRARRSVDGTNWVKSKTRLNPSGVLDIEYLPKIKKFILLPAVAGERFQFSATGK